MYSGRAEELIRRVRPSLMVRRNVQVFKSHLDDRYAGISRVNSHAGGAVAAVPVSIPREVGKRITPRTRVVAIDDVRFLDAVSVQVGESDSSEARYRRCHVVPSVDRSQEKLKMG